ncbi:MAG: GntR family transcriptional regulator [Chloroflexi bacterium]|nr:GntR family transcriptional regulator [Chloroflexota bacterium]
MSSGRIARATAVAVEPVARRSAERQPIPLYFQIVSVLESRILSGQCPPGSLLGTEKDLASEFGVSRITVIHALHTLESKGLIERKKARGTFVLPQVRTRGNLELHGSLDAVMLMGQLGETREVQCDEIIPPASVLHHLDLPTATGAVRVRRLRANGGVLNTFIIDYTPLDIGRRFTAAQLRSSSLIQLLDQEADLRLQGGHQLISARSATRDIARKFKVVAGTPILFVERDLQNRAGRTVAYSQFHYLGHPQYVRVSRVSRDLA